MNCALELHDSDIRSISLAGADLRVTFEPGYVHRSLGRPGIDAGIGYLQSVELVFANAQFSVSGAVCSGKVSDGFIEGDHVKHLNVVPLPLALAGGVLAELRFTSGAVLTVQASGVSCVTTGDAEPNFAEPYEG